MEDVYKEIIKHKNKPLFKEKISIENHKIFYKYTSSNYYKYIYDLLDTLCKKCPYDNKTSIFHMSLYFILRILYKCENNPYLTNLDLIALNCFVLGVKSIIKQKDYPSISRVKKIYEEKYNNYKNEEIYEGEIICLKLLNYNINIITAYDYVIYLTNNDLKLRELSIINLNFFMINNLRQFIYKSSFDIAKECIKTIKEKMIIKEPKIIKKKIISISLSSYGFNNNPIMKKYSSTDKIINSNNNSSDEYNQINNDENMPIKTKPNISSKKSNALICNMNLKNSADKVYYKKNCNDIRQCPSTFLISEVNNINDNNGKKGLLYNKINKITGNKYIYKTNNNNNNFYKKKSIDMNRRKIYLNNNNNRFKRNKFAILDNNNNNNNIFMNNTQYIKRNTNNYNIENDSYYLNLFNQKRDSDNNFYNYNNNSPNEEQDLRDSYYESSTKGTKYAIETRNINLGALTKCKKNSNFVRYNKYLRKNDLHQKLNSTNYFNNNNCSQEGNYKMNNKNSSYNFIRW